MIDRAPVPAASVVITNHDYGRFVGAAIDSALAQTVPCEVIVVDDGSTDDSRSVIEGRVAGHPDRIHPVLKANGGQASAFNAGWAAVGAPVVFFLDGDDVLDPEAVERVLAQFDHQPDLTRCQFRLRWIDEAGRTVPGGLPEADRSLPSGDLRDRLIRAPDDIAWQPTSGGAFAAEVLGQLLPMPEEPYRISADHYLSNLAAVHGPVGAIESELGGYRVHGANADHRAGFDLVRSREILVRTEETRRHLIAHGRDLGLAMPSDPDGFRSLTTAGLRLTSFRLDSAQPEGRHPFPDDDRLGLFRQGLAAARGRSDFSPLRRLLAMAWIGLLATAPRPLVAPVASRALTR